eukprot:Gb_20358 [translate_table: standard]
MHKRPGHKPMPRNQPPEHQVQEFSNQTLHLLTSRAPSNQVPVSQPPLNFQ